MNGYAIQYKAGTEGESKAGTEGESKAGTEGESKAGTEGEGKAGTEGKGNVGTEGKAWTEGESKAWTEGESKAGPKAMSKAWTKGRGKAGRWQGVDQGQGQGGAMARRGPRAGARRGDGKAGTMDRSTLAGVISGPRYVKTQGPTKFKIHRSREGAIRKKAGKVASEDLNTCGKKIPRIKYAGFVDEGRYWEVVQGQWRQKGLGFLGKKEGVRPSNYTGLSYVNTWAAIILLPFRHFPVLCKRHFVIFFAKSLYILPLSRLNLL